MIEAKGDVWEYPADVICIPTNCELKHDGTAVMGKGVALQAQERFPWLPERLGKELSRGGSFGAAFSDVHDRSPMLRSFPVKYWWRDPAVRALSDVSSWLGYNKACETRPAEVRKRLKDAR